MKRTCKWLVGSCAAALLSVSSFAQAVDCSKARNPQNCEARQKAMEGCKDKTGPTRRQCVEDNMPPRDCSKAKSQQRCEDQQKAREACKGKVGKERRACMHEQLPKRGARAPAKP